MLGKLENLRKLLKQGHAPRDLVAQGYPQTSVYKAARQLRRGRKWRASGKRGPGGKGQGGPRLCELVSCLGQEDESLRSETEARAAAIAARRSGRERQEVELDTRGEGLFNRALAAYEAGTIDSTALVLLAWGGNTLKQIERNEKVLEHLERSSLSRADEARAATIAEERARGGRELAELKARGRRLFNDAIRAHRSGAIDNYALVHITSRRNTLAEIKEGENLLGELQRLSRNVPDG